ncbi:hypothetical protein K438DRAFT_2012093 [Mycena galopus ATCC 62051]|nr:hypothetical protein K438DRAFT_2012093 [Mycena galopus ATCC 62051]
MLLNSNEAPEPFDVGVIQAAISAVDKRLAFLSQENLAEETPQNPEWTSLLIYRARNRAVLSPLRRVPPEILGGVFLPKTADAACTDIRSGSPWVFTHVSSRRREVAISTPSLWSRIVVDCHKCLSYSLSAVKARMQRANTLRIYFYGATRFRSSVSEATEMFKYLPEHSSRWTELTIGVTTSLLPLLAALHRHLPVLHRLWIQWDSAKSQLAQIDCFQAAPGLRDVTIYNDSTSNIKGPPPSLSAQQLTRYDADGPWVMHRAFLLLAQNLVELRLETNSTSGYSSDIISLSHLRRLFLSHVEVLDHLRAPVSEEIALEAGGGK